MKKLLCSRMLKFCLPALLWVLTDACNKKNFLNTNPSSALVVPTTLDDFQALLDNDQVMGLVPALGEISADNYYMDDNFLSGLNPRVQNAYKWLSDIFQDQQNIEDWNFPYTQVYYANVVLDGLTRVKVTDENQVQWNSVKGESLFVRAFAFYNIAEVFTRGYDSAGAITDMGIPIRLSPDVNIKSVRASMRQTYNQIVGDLCAASGLLPATVASNYLNRPNRPAAQAMLARVYLSLRKYDSAGIYADSALASNSALIDYNRLDPSVLIPIRKQNVEILYQARPVDYGINTQVLQGLLYPDVLIDTTLLRSYASNDLRRDIFYLRMGMDSFILKGSYTGATFLFCGLATDELYLIRAECRARAGQVGPALNDLNTLLVNRWKAGTFTNYSISSPAVALDTILSERRKELPFRGLRWSDLKRLNRSGANIKLTRNINGIKYSLAPNSKLYALPIPPDVLVLSGIPQNDRN